MDPTLLFNVLFVADGFCPQFAKRVDPTAGPLRVKVSPVPDEPPAPRTLFYGRVLDPEGKPVMGAVVNIHMYWYADGTGTSRAPEGSDPLGITDNHGNFQIRHTRTLQQADVMVKARGLAPKRFHKVPIRDEPVELRLIRGAAVRGRLLRNGQPVPGVMIGLVQTNRNASDFVGEFTIGTDHQGMFLLPNVTPGFEYALYGKMDTLQGIGAVPVQTLQVRKDEEIIDVGNLAAVRGHRIAGQVVLSDGKPVPPDTRLSIGRDKAWDTLLISLDESGRFEARDLPAEVYRIVVRIPAYHLADSNPNLHPVHRCLVGHIDRDLDDFVILLGPGEARPLPWDDRKTISALFKRAETLKHSPFRPAARELDLRGGPVVPPNDP